MHQKQFQVHPRLLGDGREGTGELGLGGRHVEQRMGEDTVRNRCMTEVEIWEGNKEGKKGLSVFLVCFPLGPRSVALGRSLMTSLFPQSSSTPQLCDKHHTIHYSTHIKW